MLGALSVDGGHAGGQTGGPQEPSLEALVLAVRQRGRCQCLKLGVFAHILASASQVMFAQVVVPVPRGAQGGSVAAPMKKVIARAHFLHGGTRATV